MKIFCKTREYANPLDRFVGKPVWVRCKLWIGGTHWSHNDFWVKFIFSDDKTYDVISVMAGSEDYDGLRYETDMKVYKDSKRIRTRAKDTIVLVEPIEVMTDDELFSIDKTIAENSNDHYYDNDYEENPESLEE